MTISKHFCLFILFLLSAASVKGQQTGESVFRFLELNGDARSAALGGPHAVFINPQSSQFLNNPALLQASDTNQLHLSYLNHLDDISFGTANYAYKVPDVGIFSASVRFLNYGGMTRFDEFGNDQGSTSANDLALTAGYSANLAKGFSYGVSFTGIHSSLTGIQSTAVSLSGGLVYQLSERETAFGFYLNNAGRQLSTFNGVSEPLPLNIAAGIVHRLRYIPVRLHFTLQRLNDWELENAKDTESLSVFENISRHILGGAEFLFGDHVTGSIGYDYWLHNQAETDKRIDGAGLSLGVAIHLSKLDVQFSRTSFSDLGSVVQLGISLPL